VSGQRHAGYCVACDRIVEYADDGGCSNGHPFGAMAGDIVLAEAEAVPALPRFNLAAFLIPPIWGPAHGQWAGAILLPIWLFADSILRNAAVTPGGWAGAAVVVSVTLAMMGWFGKRGNGLAWRRVADRVPVERFVRTQRIWAIVAVPVAVALLGSALYYDLVVLPARVL